MRLPMKVMFLGLCMSVLAVSMALMAYAEEDTLSPYEQALFSHSYSAESLHDRLGRLEQSVFGELQAGTDAEREARLLNTLKAISRTWKTVSDPNTVAPSENEQAHDEPVMTQQASRPKDATDYPTVTALERTVFGRDFIQDDVSVRLTRLEKRALGSPSPEMAMVDRVDRLLSKYPEAKAGVMHQTPLETTNPVLKQLPSDTRQFAGGGGDVYAKVEALERHFFNQASNAKMMLTERLDQLERQAYGQTLSGESIDTRVNRLMSQYMAAKATGPGPKVSQTGQPQVIYDSSSARPQNVQIGTGFSQNSQIQFSQDLMDMLPNDVRNQLQNQTGTTITGSGTVIMKSETQYPGFQTYGGPPIQYYNYYGTPNTPNTKIQSQTTTTVIQPNGSTVVYGYNPVPGTMPNPAYVGDPAFLQQLNSVEANVFGRVDAMLPIQTRLNNLEMAILQKTQPNLPEVERLNTVFRSWKIQQISQVIGPNGKKSTLGIPLNSGKK